MSFVPILACTVSPCSSTLPHSAPFLQSALPSSPIWSPSNLLAILANIGFSASAVVLNAYPLRLAVSSLPFSDHGDPVKFSSATARISLIGIALGYAAGILLLLVTCFLCSAQGVYGCAAIRYLWLWGMVGIVFRTRATALAGCEDLRRHRTP
jgi:hypothetical protein